MCVSLRAQTVRAATELFNKHPSKCVGLLQERGLLSSPLEPLQVASWLHANPALSKAALGEYIGSAKNHQILLEYVRCVPECAVPGKRFTLLLHGRKFHLSGTDLVTALRLFLEAFRLPGESPIISRILETFSQHWLVSA